MPFSREWFSVAVAVSPLGCTDIHFLEPRVIVNGEYCCNTVLYYMLLPDIRRVSGDWMYIFHQDSAPAHRARATVEILDGETPEFISPLLWHPNSPDLNPVDYSVLSILQEKVYKTSITDLDDLKYRIRTKWAKLAGSRRHCCSCASMTSFSLCQGRRWHFEHCF